MTPRKNDDNLRAMQILFDALEEITGQNGPAAMLGMLKELRIRVNDDEGYYTKDLLDTIHSFARMCRKTLEVWLGNYWLGNYSLLRDRESLKTALALFARLRVVHLDLPQHRSHYKGVTQDWALDLAIKCPALEEIVTHNGDLDGSYVSGSVRITRDGGIPGVVSTKTL